MIIGRSTNTLGQLVDTALADELWQEFYTKKGRGWLAVKTDSMAPLIRPGDRVLISRVAAEHVNPGDIVVFKRGENMIVHRVLKVLRTTKGIRFVEKGDGSEFCRVFGPDDVTGKVTLVQGFGSAFDLDSPVSRFTNRTLAACLYFTFMIAARLRTSSRRNIRRCGRILTRLLLISSNILLRICCVVWYLSGIKHREITEPS